MKFVRFASDKYPNGVYGLIEADGIHILKGGLFDPVEKTGEMVQESDIRKYLPPVNPPNILAIGLNYVDHAAESSQKLPEKPLVFMKATSSIIGHGDSILLPKIAPDQVDFEAELGVVIGKAARHVSEEDALDYVFGYTCLNDVSARDCQMSDGQWIRGKSFDTFCPLGPHVVTGINPDNIRVQLILNGDVMQDQSTCDMVFPVRTLIGYLSKSMTLLPGTIISSGTPSGVGFARKPPVFLKSGDTVEVVIEQVGTLRNGVTAEQ